MNNTETLKNFREKNDKAVEILEKLKEIISNGTKLGLAISPAVIKKIERVTEMMGENQKLKVALIGGFSEGKTSIAAAWLGRIDKSSMKICQQESSDEVNVYDVDSEIELIDTPGLFGFKEKYNDDERVVEKYKYITKKYVSEAHLVLYVMDPTNPIKASHKEDLQWLFRELGLLSRTVFVLSRFDEVADMEDNWEYNDTLNIKKENVLGRLKDMIGLTPEEADTVEIIGVAANPFGKGMEYWLNHIEQLKELSKIDNLQQATAKTIERKGGFFPIVYEAQKSAINDILTGNVERIESTAAEIETALEAYKDNVSIARKNLINITAKGNVVQGNLIKFVSRYIGGLKAQVNGCGMSTFQSFIDAEIGKEGCIMYATIQNEFNTQLKTVEVALEHATLEFNADFEQFDSTMEIMGKQGLDYLRLSGAVSAKNILAVRDGIKGLGKMLGTDLGGLLKFKPWGATNLASHLTNALQVVGIIMEIWDSYKKAEAEEKFRNAVKGMNDDFDKTQQELLSMLQGDDFLERSFPEYTALKEKVENGEMRIKEIEARKADIEQWVEECKKIASVCNML